MRRARTLSCRDEQKLVKALEELNKTVEYVDELYYTCQKLMYGNRTRYNQRTRFRLINEALEKGYLK